MFINTPSPEPGTWKYRLVEWFVNKVNFCEGVYYRTDIAKPVNKVYDWFYEHWLWPFKQNDCLCCNTVRGVLYGIIVGVVAGVLL